jgi:hypothetical protein
MFLTLIGSAIVLLGIASIVWFLRLHRRAVIQAKAAQGWPTVSGEILESRIAVEESTDSDGNTGHSYHPVLRYRYAVGGREFEGKRLRFGVDRSGSEGTIKAWLMPYREGARPKVRYNPVDPADCVLEAVRPTAAYIVAAALVGGILILIGTVMAVAP